MRNPFKSNIQIVPPLIYNYHPNKPEQGIPPDHAVSTTQEYIYEGRDTQLQHVLSIITRESKPRSAKRAKQ